MSDTTKQAGAWPELERAKEAARGTNERGVQGMSERPKTADEIVREAYANFDAWLSAQSDEVQGMTLLEQINLYSDHEVQAFVAAPEPAA